MGVMVPSAIDIPEEGCWLVVEDASGVDYTAQTHGVGCCHPVARGVLRPLTWPEPPDSPHEGCWGVHEPVSAAMPTITAWIARESSGALAVDDRPGEWGEAWVPVRLSDGSRGVVTYPNCD